MHPARTAYRNLLRVMQTLSREHSEAYDAVYDELAEIGDQLTGWCAPTGTLGYGICPNCNADNRFKEVPKNRLRMDE